LNIPNILEHKEKHLTKFIYTQLT